MSYNDDLIRFLDAGNKLYLTAFSELKRGKKETHWMWFIFPQLRGLGTSSLSEYYGIASIEEANDYMAHPILSKNLIEISKLLMLFKRKSPEAIFGDLDARKLFSCMTLFSKTNNAHSIFKEVLDVFFYGCEDAKTMNMLFPEFKMTT